MSNEITDEYAKKAQKEAEWAYNQAIDKFYYSMLEVVFLRIKSQLNQDGLKKVIEVDKRRSSNENLGIEFSQKTWAILAESWFGSESEAIRRISDLYGLTISDFEKTQN